MGFDYGAAKCVPTGCCSCLVFVSFAVGVFLALTFECSPDLPDAFLVDVLFVSSCSSCKGLDGLGVGDKVLDLLLDRDDELFSVGCAEGLCSFDFLCVANVVFGSEQCVDGICAHDVSVGGLVFVVGCEYGRWRVLAVHDFA